MSKQTAIVSKLSAKDILGPVHEIVKDMEIDERREAYAIAGICNAYVTGVSTFGEWVRFMGEIHGINYFTGEAFRAGGAHLPRVLEESLMGYLGEGKVNTQKSSTKEKTVWYDLDTTVEMSFKVYITRKANKPDGGVSYNYSVVPMQEVKRSEQLDRLVSLLDAPKTPALEAPEPEAEEKPKKAAKKA